MGIKICQIELIRNDLESGEQDPSIDDVGFRVNDPKMRFRVRVKDFKSQVLLGLKDFKFRRYLIFDVATKFRLQP